MDKRAVALSEAAGCVLIYSAAVLLHFVYPLSKGAALSIVFGSVNESVWEHTKIFAAPYIGWALLQLCWLKVHFRQYVVAKVIGLYVMAGMIIGSNPRMEDITVNVCKAKHLTNTRASGSDDALRLIPPKQMSLEQCLEYLADDELLEVTPKTLRMRKRILNHADRMK